MNPVEGIFGGGVVNFPIDEGQKGCDGFKKLNISGFT